MRVRLVRVAAVAALALVMAGCTRTLDKQSLEAQLATDLQSNGSTYTVACPDGVKAQAGGTFQCTATGPDGTSLALTVTQTDDQGNVTWEVTGGSGATPTTSPPSSPSPTT
jgi:hypothetical protein